MAERVKTALVLSGGGFKGAFQIGALDYLREAGLIDPEPRFDVIAGISAGALNGAFIASGQYDFLKTIWQRIEEEGSSVIYTSEFLSEVGTPQLSYETIKARFFPNYQLKVSLWRGLQLLLSSKQRNRFIEQQLAQVGQEATARLRDFQAIASNQPLANLLRQHLNQTQIPADAVFTTGFVSLVNGRYYNPKQTDYASNEDFIQGVLASTTVPVVWAPVDRVNLEDPQPPIRQLIDGGLKNSSPLGDVIKLMDDDRTDVAYRILIINNNSGKLAAKRKAFNIIEVALRSLTEITLAEIFENDIREFVRVNDLVRQAREQGVVLRNAQGRPLRQFSYKIIQPQEEELGEVFDSTPETLSRRYALGRQRSEEAFANPYGVDWSRTEGV